MSSYTLAELAQHLDGTLHGCANQLICGISSLSRASKTDLTYFDNPALLESLSHTQAGAVLLTIGHLRSCQAINAIVVENPLLSMMQAAEWFAPPPIEQSDLHPTAFISPTAIIGKNVSVGPNAVIGDEVSLGDQVSIAANCVIEAGVCIGNDSVLHNGVSIHRGSKLGARVTIESGAVLGASPFNSVKKQGHWLAGPAVGGVLIADQVQIGANTVIARGALGDTFIDEGVYIDNLVQIAHDVTIGANSAIAGCAAIGAYVRIGAHCIVGGASCVAAHVHLVDDIVITGMSTVNKSLSKPGVYSSGIMVAEHRQWRRNAARFRRLDDYIMRLTALEKKWQKGAS